MINIKVMIWGLRVVHYIIFVSLLTLQDVHAKSDGIIIRRLIEVEAMLDYENPGSNTRHQPGRGKGRRPRFYISSYMFLDKRETMAVLKEKFGFISPSNNNVAWNSRSVRLFNNNVLIFLDQSNNPLHFLFSKLSFPLSTLTRTKRILQVQIKKVIAKTRIYLM